MSPSGLEMEIKQERRLCTVNGETGYFHTWEQYSKPLEASPFFGGAPAGVFSKIFGIVEFEDGIRRVDPTGIKFCDEENEMLSVFNKRGKSEKIKESLTETNKKKEHLCPTCEFDRGGSYSSMCSWCEDFNCYEKKGE